MIISIIGSGNTAIVLGKLFAANNHSINEIIGRNKITAQQLAQTLNANACFNIEELNTSSDIYIIAVRDNNVAEVAAQLNLQDKIVVHTCGSVSLNVLAKSSENYGALYPLQSLRKELSYAPAIPFLVDGNNEFVKNTIFNLASSVADKIMYADDETRLRYHLSAIVVSNFTNHLFALAKNYCDINKIDFSLLLPLIEEVANRLHNYDPALMQTGPAIRGDEQTIQKHLSLLNDFPQLRKLYEVMSESIKQSPEAIK